MRYLVNNVGRLRRVSERDTPLFSRGPGIAGELTRTPVEGQRVILADGQPVDYLRNRTGIARSAIGENIIAAGWAVGRQAIVRIISRAGPTARTPEIIVVVIVRDETGRIG